MDCKEFQRMIPDFLGDELDNYSLESFLNHIDSCKSCKEELTIQFLIETGIQRLEDGSTFNLSNELQSTMNDAWTRLRLRKRLLKTAYFLQVMVVLEIIAAIALSIALR
ncbi:zf-HC2 domain-containing protein [Butyrivibrio sp. VCD2006]|uniref:zf-HC2 domain-containing protein n=1 Tax=Butyrivibrio sp. VCD2006 TaxID=1280664 RepID=UPI0003FD25CB|nr:zf-HC2 domain-containing protein [Butyrivibrio sp. VCD2006]